MKTQNILKKILFLPILLFLSTNSLFATIEIANTIPPSAGACDGQITTLTDGTAGPFTVSIYQIIGADFNLLDTQGPINGELTFTGLCEGDYSITVIGQTECESTLTTSIEECSSITISPSPNISHPTDCNSVDGNIRFFSTNYPQGGTPPYSFLWSTGETELNMESLLSAGTYTLTVTDTKGCTGEFSYVLEGEEEPITDVELAPACVGQNNGHLSIFAYTPGSNVLYNFVWNTGQVDDNVLGSQLSDLVAGIYTVTISTEGGACSFVEEIVIEELSAQEPLSVSGEVERACAGTDGSGGIDLTVNGGVPPYRFSWSPKGYGLRPRGLDYNTEYCVTVTDYCEATATECFTIGSKPNTLEVQGNMVRACPITSTNNSAPKIGGVVLDVSGGIPPYGYTWSTGSHQKNLSGVPPGEYCVTVSDAYSCKKIECYDVKAYDLNISLVDFQNCEDGDCSDAFIDIELISNATTPPYSFQWVPFGASTEDLYNIPSTGSYEVVVRDNNQCQYRRSFPIGDCDDIDPFVLESHTIVPASPINNDWGFIDLVITPINNSLSFSWTGPNNFTATHQNIYGDGPGTYTVVISNGCNQTETATFEIEECSLDIAVLDVDHACSDDGYGTVDVVIRNASVNDKYYLLSHDKYIPFPTIYNSTFLEARGSFVSHPGEGCFAIINQDLCGGLACTEIQSSEVRVERRRMIRFLKNPSLDRYIPYYCETGIYCQDILRDREFDSVIEITANSGLDGGCFLYMTCGDEILGESEYTGQVEYGQVSILGNQCKEGTYCITEIDMGLDRPVRLEAELSITNTWEVFESSVTRDGECITQKRCVYRGPVLEEAKTGIPSESMVCGNDLGYGNTCVRVTGCGEDLTKEPVDFPEARFCCEQDFVFSLENILDPNIPFNDLPFNSPNDVPAQNFSDITNPTILPGFTKYQKENDTQASTNMPTLFKDDIPKPITSSTEIRVYPNPFNNEIVIQIPQSQSISMPLEISILNNLGQNIKSIYFQEPQAEYKLDLNDLSPGIFHLYLRSRDGKFWTKKIVKTNSL